MNEVMVGSMVVVSALLPSNASTINGNPEASVSNPIVICGSSRRSLPEPWLTEPICGVGFEVQGGHVVEHQRGRPQRRMRRAGRRQALAPRLLGVDRQAARDG